MLRALAALTLAVSVLTVAPAGASDTATPTSSPTGAPSSGTPTDPSFAGETIEPGATAAQALSIGTGLYAVEVGPDTRELYVSIPRTVPGSQIWYGFSALLPPVDDSYNGLVVRSRANGTGASCVRSESLFDLEDESDLKTVLVSTGRREECRTADSILLRMDAAKVPAGTYQLVVWEEPGIDGEDRLPQPGTVSWSEIPVADPASAETVTAGTTYADAPELAGGSYTVRVLPGVPTLFRVPLTWGQHAQVLAQSTADIPTYTTVGIRWLTPLGGQVDETAYGQGGPGAAGDLVRLDGSADPTGVVSPIVAWRNRDQRGSDAPAAFVGDYYLSFDGHSTDLPAQGVDVTFTLATVTDFPAAEPDYTSTPPPMPYVDGSADPRAAAAASAAASDETAADGSAGDGAGGPGTGTTVAVVVGLLVVALLFVGGGIVVRRRSRP